MDERGDYLDEALDDALTSYGGARGREGLERRILAGVRVRAVRARRKRAAAAALCTAAALAGLWFWPAKRADAPREAVRKTVLPMAPRAPAAIGEFAQYERFAAGETPKSGRKLRAEPRLPVFPSPVFAGLQERALLRLADYRARHAAQDLSYLGRAVTPIQIAEIEIEPMMANKGETNAEMDNGDEFGGADEPHMPGAN